MAKATAGGKTGATHDVRRYRRAVSQGRNQTVVYGSGLNHGAYSGGTRADCHSIDGRRRAADAALDAGVCCGSTAAAATTATASSAAGPGTQAGRRSESGRGAGRGPEGNRTRASRHQL